MEAEYISLSQLMTGVLTFVSLMKYIYFVLKLQKDTPTVLCSIFENPVTVQNENQGSIALAVYRQMRPRTKHILIKYHHFRSFVLNVDVEIKYVETKEQIVDIFTKLLYSELFVYIRYKLNGWWINCILLNEGF